MATSRISYVGDGVTTDFVVPFPYLTKSHVKVSIDVVEQLSGWSWLSSSVIRFTAAPAAASVVLIRRVTSPTVRLVDFINGGQLTEADLDMDSLQCFYLAQEANDNIESTMAIDLGDARWNAQNLQMKNLGAPTEASHAVRKADLDAATIIAGNVPTPSNPADDGKVLVAGGGLWSWATILLNKISNLATYWRTRLASDPSATVQSMLDGANAAAIRTTLDVPSLSTTNDWPAPQGFNGRFINITAKATEVPPTAQLSLISETTYSSPANIVMYAYNASLNLTSLSQLQSQYLDATAGEESARMVFLTTRSGASAERMAVGAGVSVGGAADPAYGQVNVTGGYKYNGYLIPIHRTYAPTPIGPVGPGGVYTWAHNIGVLPRLVNLLAYCITPEHGYNAGEFVLIGTGSGGGTYSNISVSWNTNTIWVTVSTASFLASSVNKASGAQVTLSYSKWQIVPTIWY